MQINPKSAHPRPIRLITNRFLLRSLQPGDVTERWLAWLADPQVMTPLGNPVKKARIADVHAFLRRFDNVNSFAVGIFDKSANNFLIGYFQISVDVAHGLATFNVIIGEKEYWGRGVVNEARAALLDEMFNRHKIEKVIGLPYANNHPAIFNYKAQGWTLEGVFRSHRRQQLDGKRVDQSQFAMLKRDWRSRKQENGS